MQLTHSTAVQPLSNIRLPIFAGIQTSRCGKRRALAFTAIHEQPFPLSHYSVTGCSPSVTSTEQTSDLSRDMIRQRHRSKPHSKRETSAPYRSLFITEMECVYCAVRPQSVITTRILILVSQGLNMYAVIVLRRKLEPTCKMKSYKH